MRTGDIDVSKQMLHENSPLDSESDPDPNPVVACTAKPATSIGFVVVVSVGVSVAVSDSVGVVLGKAVVDAIVVVAVTVLPVLMVLVALTDSRATATVSSCPWSGIVAIAPGTSDSDSVMSASPWRDAHPCEREEDLSL